ncbi:LysR family transcriptional regulator [Streptomyces sp. CB02923]|uniref:LysR family transcriptional regulator n=1 Tax=Streptomyces sp. CB02923 TaxID=1718985 RepID=UPI00093B5922|nr:LysR family transcriptional regulator [Streptomyces sp. CB02923]OKH98196.1 LysR family transcriptional regulator [Streptomyces sp. CB02923]
MTAQGPALDLNLLTALDALLEEESVTAAADRLGLSGPAMSRALGRIRRTVGDPVLVRAGRRMVPTPRALEIRAAVHRTVRDARSILTPAPPADPAELRRVFTLHANDLFTTVVGPGLLGRAARQAPGVTLRFLGESHVDVPVLREGDADLEIGMITGRAPELHVEDLYADGVAAVVREDHPLARGTLTARRLADAPHVTFSRRGRLTGPVDAALAELGLRRKVIATVPTFAAAMLMAADTDAVAFAPERVGARSVRRLGLRALPVPLELPPVAVGMAWHPRQDGDAGHAWLRGLVREVVADAISPAS